MTREWPMSGRYAQARANQSLVFGDTPGTQVRKDTIARKWVPANETIARLLNVPAGTRVLHRRSRTIIDDEPIEDVRTYYPPDVVGNAPALETDERIRVVATLEAAGYSITRTINEIRARPATGNEHAIFLDQFLTNADSTIIEHTHVTLAANGEVQEAVEAVVSIRPATGNTLTYHTDETPESLFAVFDRCLGGQIGPTLTLLGTVWRANPHLRLGQLIGNAAIAGWGRTGRGHHLADTSTSYYTADDVIRAGLIKMRDDPID